jgi:hypothetical protein
MRFKVEFTGEVPDEKSDTTKVIPYVIKDVFRRADFRLDNITVTPNYEEKNENPPEHPSSRKGPGKPPAKV